MSITFKHKINCRKLKISGKFAQYVSNINLDALIIWRTYIGRRPWLVLAAEQCNLQSFIEKNGANKITR